MTIIFWVLGIIIYLIIGRIFGNYLYYTDDYLNINEEEQIYLVMLLLPLVIVIFIAVFLGDKLTDILKLR